MHKRTREMERFSPAEEFATALAVLPAPAATGTQILVVEDDADCGLGMAIWLEHIGHAVTIVRNGADAIRLIERHEPPVVLLDLGLPGMHGLKVLHEIRMRRVATHVIVVTATSAHGTAAQAIAMGAQAVLRKPVDRAELRELIAELLPQPRVDSFHSAPRTGGFA